MGEIVLVVIVLVLATAGTLILRSNEGAAEASRVEILRFAADLHAHSAVEWHVIADGSVSEEMREREAELARRLMQSSVVLNHSGLPTGEAAFPGALDAYLTAARRELLLVERGDVEAAREIDETLVDPAFSSLERLVRVNDRALEGVAEESSRNADVGSIAIAVGTMLALLYLGRRILRAEKLAEREAALALARAEREQELRQAQRLESVGRLAGGVAHDFNNLLTVVMGYGGILAQELDADHPCQDAVSNVLGAAERASTLTRKLLQFGRKQVGEPREIELGHACERMITLLEGAVGTDVDLTLTIREPVIVLADPGEVDQVLLNLVVNARDAMPGGGRIELSVGTRVLDSELRIRGERLARGRYAELVVRDTGTGMDEETASRIFEPYFTTKGTLGHGLGLSSVSGIVAQSGGLIDLETAPGRGSEFRVLLPAVQPVESIVERDAPRRSPALA